MKGGRPGGGPVLEISTLFFEFMPAAVFSQQSIVATVIYHQFQGFFPTPKIKEVTAIWKSSIFVRIGVWSGISRLKSPETPGEGFRDATPTPAVGMSSPLQIPWIQYRLTHFITFFRPTTGYRQMFSSEREFLFSISTREIKETNSKGHSSQVFCTFWLKKVHHPQVGLWFIVFPTRRKIPYLKMFNFLQKHLAFFSHNAN